MRLVIDPSRQDRGKRCKKRVCRDQGKVRGVPGPAIKIRDEGRADGGDAAIGKAARDKAGHDQGKRSRTDRKQGDGSSVRFGKCHVGAYTVDI